MTAKIETAKLKACQTRQKYRNVRKQFFYYSEHLFPELEADESIAHMRAQATSFDTGLPICLIADYDQLREIHRNNRGITVSSARRHVFHCFIVVVVYTCKRG